MAWLGRHQLSVTGVDRSRDALQVAGSFGRVVEADIETNSWPLMAEHGQEQFDAVLVTNYLWRPLWPLILGSIRDKGFLIYETFMLGNEAYGKPSNPDFLLQPGELLEVCRDMSILAFEQGLLTEPKRCVQRIVAKRNDLAAGDLRPNLDSLK